MAMRGPCTSISKYQEEKGESAARPMLGATGDWNLLWAAHCPSPVAVIFRSPATSIPFVTQLDLALPQSEFDPKAGRMNVQTAACIVLVTLNFGATYGKNWQYFNPKLAGYVVICL